MGEEFATAAQTDVLSGDDVECVNENPRSGNTNGLLSKVERKVEQGPGRGAAGAVSDPWRTLERSVHTRQKGMPR